MAITSLNTRVFSCPAGQFFRAFLASFCASIAYCGVVKPKLISFKRQVMTLCSLPVISIELGAVYHYTASPSKGGSVA
jgi:hypothetical protein